MPVSATKSAAFGGQFVAESEVVATRSQLGRNGLSRDCKAIQQRPWGWEYDRLRHCGGSETSQQATFQHTENEIRIPISLVRTCHRGGRRREKKQIHLFHGTRDALVPLILNNDSQSSERSHKVLGVCTSKSKAYARCRAATCLDFFSGCCLELTAPKSAVRHNENVGVGNAVMQTSTEVFQNRAQITAVMFLVPSKAQSDFRRQVKDVCRACIKDVVTKPSIRQHVAKQTWGLLLDRLSHSAAQCARSEEWFGRFKNVRVISVKFSLALFFLLVALSSTSKKDNGRQAKFEKACKWAEYPRKLRQWLLQTWGPGIRSCFVDCDADENLTDWSLGWAKSLASDAAAGAAGVVDLEDRIAAPAAAPPAKRPRRASGVLEPLPTGENQAVPNLQVPVSQEMRPRRAGETPAVPLKRAPVKPVALPARPPRRASEELERLPAGETMAVPRLRVPVSKQMRPGRRGESPAVPVEPALVEPEAQPLSGTLEKQLPKRCQSSAFGMWF